MSSPAAPKIVPAAKPPSSPIVIRAFQPSDAADVARLWKEGLAQTTDTISWLCLPKKLCMCLLLKQMEVSAFGKRGDVGPNGKNLAGHWGGVQADDLSSCKLMLVAVDTRNNDAVVGCCGVTRGTDEKKDVVDKAETDVFSIWRLSVSAEARGRGLGRRLMNACEEAARLRGGKKMELYTGNPAASKFYLKLGYKKTSAFAHKKSLEDIKT